MKRFFVAGLAVLAVCAVASASGSTKATQHIDTSVNFGGTQDIIAKRTPDFERFYGNVSSPNKKCSRSRRVEVFSKHGSSPDFKLGYDTTDSKGNWSLTIPYEDVQNGPDTVGYYGKASTKKISKHKVCKGDRSSIYSLLK